jgi:hypothetical protein
MEGKIKPLTTPVKSYYYGNFARVVCPISTEEEKLWKSSEVPVGELCVTGRFKRVSLCTLFPESKKLLVMILLLLKLFQSSQPKLPP